MKLNVFLQIIPIHHILSKRIKSLKTIDNNLVKFDLDSFLFHLQNPFIHQYEEITSHYLIYKTNLIYKTEYGATATYGE